MPVKNYRRDIDGLRALAVLAVIFFHLGFLPNGYLGVDIFFVISGYLITGIVFTEVIENRFSILQFYLRRIRRIIPLVLFTTSIALIIGLFVMLPNDLENLSQSVLATNFFANNILLLITTKNYWNIVNEYKPLMHTWSLGIEEQFYILYPIIFLVLGGKKAQLILPFLVLLTFISLFIFISSSDETYKFYSIQFRLFELSFGGIGAIFFKDKVTTSRYKVILISVLLIILLLNIHISNTLKLFLIVIASLGVLISTNNLNKTASLILENKLMVGVGKISFSLYMWHQIVLAFTRYFILEKIDIMDSVLIVICIFLLSIFSYSLVEQPFRDRKIIKTPILLLTTGALLILSTSISLYIYSIAGITKDVPELEIFKTKVQRNLSVQRNANVQNNELWKEYSYRVFALDKDFTDNDKIKVLIIGNSYSRDWANILLESKYKNLIEISYIPDTTSQLKSAERLGKADYIFFSAISRQLFDTIARKLTLDTSKVWNIGIKNFGFNNGIFYNRKNKPGYCIQRTNMRTGVLERNNFLKSQWGGNMSI